MSTLIGRRLGIALLLVALAACAACGGGNSSGGPVLSATPEQRPELSAADIRDDINGEWVRLKPADGKSEPRNWVFDEDEPKEIEVVEQQIGPDKATFLLNMKTRTVGRARNPVSIEGQLRLHYELETGLLLRQWEITEIENISFKYTPLEPEPTPSGSPGAGQSPSPSATPTPAPPSPPRPPGGHS